VQYSYCSQSNCCRSQPYQPSISRVRLMYGIGVVVAELVNDPGNLVVITVCKCIADDRFKPATLLCQLPRVQPVVMVLLRFLEVREEGDQVSSQRHCMA